MIELTRLWENTSRKGEKFFSGSFGKARIVVLKNGYKKEGSNEPDYIIYLDEAMKAPSVGKAEKTQDTSLTTDDIPF